MYYVIYQQTAACRLGEDYKRMKAPEVKQIGD